MKEYPTQRLARRRLETLLAEVNAPDYRPRRIATLAEFVERWRRDVLSHHKVATVKAAESHLRSHILPELGPLQLEEITSEVQQQFVIYLSSRLKRKTVSNVLSTLSAILRMAKKWGYTCTGVNFEALTLPERGERIEARFFTPEEVRRILASTPEPYATAFEVAALTAVRPGELFGLKVTDLDFDRRMISIRRSARYSKLQAPKTNASAPLRSNAGTSRHAVAVIRRRTAGKLCRAPVRDPEGNSVVRQQRSPTIPLARPRPAQYSALWLESVPSRTPVCSLKRVRP